MTSTIENTFRMGQALQTNNKKDLAMKKYMKVCQLTEELLKKDQNLQVEIHWTIYSLGYISDILSDIKDFHKAIQFRSVQQDFLEFLKASDGDTKEMVVSGNMSGITQLFEKINNANNSKGGSGSEIDKEEIVKKVQSMVEKNREEKVNDLFRQLQDIPKNDGKQMLSLADRTMNFIVNHYLMIIICSILISATLIIIIAINNPQIEHPRIPQDLKDQMKILENIVQESQNRKTPHPVKNHETANEL